MLQKFLNKEGLLRLVEILKGKFASLDSPNFTGSPTARTPSFNPKSKGKALINQEYGSQIYGALKRYADTRLMQYISLTIQPDQWGDFGGICYYEALQDLLSREARGESHVLFIFFDTQTLTPMDFLDATKNHPIALSNEGWIYIGGGRPSYDIPIIIMGFSAKRAEIK